MLLRTTWPYYSNLTQNCKFIFPLQRGSCVRALLFDWWSVQQSDEGSVGRNQVVEINPKVERQSGRMMIGLAAITRKMNREPSKRLECRKKGGSVSFLVSDFSKEGTKERLPVCQPSREMCISRAQPRPTTTPTFSSLSSSLLVSLFLCPSSKVTSFVPIC